MCSSTARLAVVHATEVYVGMYFAFLWHSFFPFRRFAGFLFANFMMVLLQKLQCAAFNGVHTVGQEVFCASASKV